mgnify:CR=1 FL=1
MRFSKYFRRSDSLWVLFAIVAVMIYSGFNAKGEGVLSQPVSLTKSEKPLADIIIPDQELTLSETFALRDLCSYLKKISGAEFKVFKESSEKKAGFSIKLGRSAVKAMGKRPEDYKPDEWFVVWKNGALLLGGGSAHGAEYAVSHFLEDVLGVHWWNGFEQYVPKMKDISFPAPDLHGNPAFYYRRNLGLRTKLDSGLAASRNRLLRNGWTDENENWISWVEKSGQGRFFSEDDTDYIDVHSLMALIHPSDQVEHPEWFALIDNKRMLPKLTQGWPRTSNISYAMCLSNDALSRVVANRLRTRIVKDIKPGAEYGLFPDIESELSELVGS